MIGECISALVNTARLVDRDRSYIVWGVADGDHALVGTQFQPAVAKVGNQPLDFWLAERLNPSPAFLFRDVPHPGGRVVLLDIPVTGTLPVQFDGKAYIRVGSATPLRRKFPQREEALMAKLRPFVWEEGVARAFVTAEQVLRLLDHGACLSLLGHPPPMEQAGILDRMAEDRLIARDVGGRWNILNIGAALFAHRLDDFDTIARKALRIVQYEGRTKLVSKPEQAFTQGYAAGFACFEAFLGGILPGRERIGTFRTVENA